MHLIVDLTKCMPNTVSQSIEQAFEYQRSHGILASNTLFIAHNGQRTLTNNVQQIRYVDELSALQDACQVAKTIANQCSGDISVVSYNGRTLSEMKSFCFSLGRRVNTFSFSNLNQVGFPSEFSPFSGNPSDWNKHQFALNLPFGIEESEALDCLQRVVQRAAENGGIRQTDLRTHLAFENARFKKTGSLEKPFIGGLIRLAEARGIVRVSREDSVNPTIFPFSSDASVSQVRLLNANSSEKQEKQAAQLIAEKQNTSPHSPTRADNFHDYLANAQLGPYTVCRNAIYEKIPEALNELVGGCLRDIVDLAGKKAKTSHQFTTDEDRKRAPWKFASRLVENLILKSGSAIGVDVSPIPNGFSAAIQPIAELAENWRSKADAELVLFLIFGFTDISQDDVEAISGVLFHSREQNGQKKVLELVRLLVSNGQICEVERQGKIFLSADTTTLTAFPGRLTG